MTVAAGLVLEGVEIRLDGRVLVALDTQIGPGEVLTVMGPSGSGKSTLLAFIAGFLSPAFRARGRVWLDGREVTTLPAEARRIGLLFQDPLLFPHLSVAGNLLFGVPRQTPDRSRRVVEALRTAGLDGFGPRDVATLSGGQQARVALLRVLLSQPEAMLLDEPFAKLDASLRREMRRAVFDQLRGAGLPTLLVTHDEADAAAAGGRVVVIGD